MRKASPDCSRMPNLWSSLASRTARVTTSLVDVSLTVHAQGRGATSVSAAATDETKYGFFTTLNKHVNQLHYVPAQATPPITRAVILWPKSPSTCNCSPARSSGSGAKISGKTRSLMLRQGLSSSGQEHLISSASVYEWCCGRTSYLDQGFSTLADLANLGPTMWRNQGLSLE